MNLSKIILTLLLTNSLLALASEENWSARTLILPTLRNEIHGYTTERSSFRIESMDHSESRLKISGGYFSKKPEIAGKLCASLGDSLQVTKQSSKNIYQLRAFVFPLAQTEVEKVRAKIENFPNLYNFEVRIINGPRSIITEDSKLDFENRAKLAIQSQLENLKENGTMHLELGQMDDVACDLIQGNAVLEIHFGLMLEDAKHTRKRVLTADDFQKVYEAIRRNGVSSRNISQRNTMYSGLLSQSLIEQLGRNAQDIGEDAFLRLSSVILNSETGNLNNISSSQYEAAARSVDALSLTTGPVLLKTTLKAEAAGVKE